jgi:hypothetical protein
VGPGGQQQWAAGKHHSCSLAAPLCLSVDTARRQLRGGGSPGDAEGAALRRPHPPATAHALVLLLGVIGVARRLHQVAQQLLYNLLTSQAAGGAGLAAERVGALFMRPARQRDGRAAAAPSLAPAPLACATAQACAGGGLACKHAARRGAAHARRRRARAHKAMSRPLSDLHSWMMSSSSSSSSSVYSSLSRICCGRGERDPQDQPPRVTRGRCGHASAQSAFSPRLARAERTRQRARTPSRRC